MKTKSMKLFFVVLTVTAALLVLPTANAGSGADYWRRLERARDENTARSQPSTTPVACTDPKLVAVTKTKNDWPNAKGPLVTTVVGSNVQCTSCSAATTVAKHSWMNGKGPLVFTDVPAKHECMQCGNDAAKS